MVTATLKLPNEPVTAHKKTQSLGKHLVELEIAGLRRKFAGTGGKILSLIERINEISCVIGNLRKLQQAHKKDKFFSSCEFKRYISGLTDMLEELTKSLDGKLFR